MRTIAIVCATRSPLPNRSLRLGDADEIGPAVAEHPLARLERVGVSVTLSTDDTTVSDITLSEEYLKAVETIGLTVPELWEIDLHALNVAFADEDDLAPLRASFAAWGEGVPELAEI